MKHSTIVDIAKKLKLSPSTVSRALSDHPDIKKETKERVRKVARELKYTPNTIAQSLKRNRTNTIGVLVPEIEHDFFSSAISGIEEVAYQAGYAIIVCQSNEDYEREVINTNVLVNQRVAGIIVSISQSTKCGDHFQDVIKRKIPLVFFDRVCEDVVASKVIIDDYACSFNAVTYLIGKGYKRIAHFAGPKELAICAKRWSGYVDALDKGGAPTINEFIRYGGLHEHDGYDSMDAMLNEGKLPDAIFAVNDPVAIGAFQRIREAKLRIPEDIAILGFSNNNVTSLVDPQMTTISQPSFEMGRKSAEILLDLIKNKVSKPRTLVLEAVLTVRGST